MFLNQQFSVLPYPKNALNEPYVLGTMFYDENRLNCESENSH